MRAECPFCGHLIEVRRKGPWPLQRHDLNGHAIAYIGRPGFRICAGSRSVLPLTESPWAALARNQETPMQLTLYREVTARMVDPGETIWWGDGPLQIDIITRMGQDVVKMTGRRPNRPSRRVSVLLKSSDRVRVIASPDEEIEAWKVLRNAVHYAASAWRKDQQDLHGADQAGADWDLDGEHDIYLAVFGRGTTMHPGIDVGSVPDLEPQTVD